MARGAQAAAPLVDASAVEWTGGGGFEATIALQVERREGSKDQQRKNGATQRKIRRHASATSVTLPSPARRLSVVGNRAVRENAAVDFAERAAHNEEVFRSINERIEEGAKQHGVGQPLPFHCECCSTVCVETIELAPSDYDRIAADSMRFVLVPGHEQAGVEAVVERHPSYLVVEKIGEARAELEHEHPRPRHRG